MNRQTRLVKSRRPSREFYFGPFNERCAFPHDVVREIMLFSVQGELGLLDHSKPPLLFSLVSPGWDRIASATQDLWTTIAVTEPYFIPQNLELVRAWLIRSGPTKPLQVTLSPSIVNPNLHVIRAFQALFLAGSHRWSYLSLSIPVALLPAMLSNPAVSLQALERLVLALPSHPMLVLSPTATRLSQVSLTTLPEHMAPHPLLLNLNWNNMTHVDLLTPAGTIEMVWRILEFCRNLCCLTIHATNNMKCPHIPYDINHRLWNNLQHLTMWVNTRPGALEYFFDALFLPQLRSLRLDCIPNIGVQEDTLWPLKALLRLYAVALPPLTHFTLRGKIVNELDLIHLVSTIKSIRQLEVYDQRFTYVTASVRALLARNADNRVQLFRQWEIKRRIAGLL